MDNEALFLKILGKIPINSRLRDKIRDGIDSPLKYALRTLGKSKSEGNDISHSCRVLANCNTIVKTSKLKLSPSDFLLLSYGALLHDISKSEVAGITDSIENALLKHCKLFSSRDSDHGVRSAHYIEHKLKAKKTGEKIRLYGLSPADIKTLCNIISFHSSGRIHSCYQPTLQNMRKELLLCLVFMLADRADGERYRVEAEQTVEKKFKSPKTKARESVECVLIKKDVIVWQVTGKSRELEQAVILENNNIIEYRVLLQLLGLPNRIVCLKKGVKIPDEKKIVNYNDILLKNICLDAANRAGPLLISGKTFPELYERIVEAFSSISVDDELRFSSKNYFGPLVLEVENVAKDEFNSAIMRSQTIRDINMFSDYTRKWLSADDKASDAFYFGYTHGQRIESFLYPYTSDDFQQLHKVRKQVKKWKNSKTKKVPKIKIDLDKWSPEGRVDQLDQVIEVLKEEGSSARKAYITIPNTMIDNPKSKFHIPEVAGPSLLVIHFRIEDKKKLSAFALLRAQELSTFFVVNYLEIKELIGRIIKRLGKTNKFKKLRPGRIVMLSSLSYFHPSAVLFDKPEICKKQDPELIDIAQNIKDGASKQKLIELLENFKRDFKEIETQWCEVLIEHIKERDIRNRFKKVCGILTRLEKKRSDKGLSVTGDLRRKKIEAINSIIDGIKGVSNV